MADLSYIVGMVASPAPIQGRAPARYISTTQAPVPTRLRQDIRLVASTTGTITDQVVLKSGATETPYVNGRVWLLRLADGYKAWEGWSNAGGYYTATGLEVGVEYVAVAIDPLRNHKTTGAGPVIAA